ncbi:MAG: histidinol-phosphatase HisJ family protein [Anaerolineae bacterium]|nr:histidinol-phosphatase HisJ family protein [Anaerolineae bacterium]
MTNRSRLNGCVPVDYHVHCHISPDSQATMAAMCQSALDQGISEIVFTDHFDRACFDTYQPDKYFEELDAVRRAFGPQGLTVRAGVELGEMHRYADVVQPVLDAWPYDFVLCGVHWIADYCVHDMDYFRAHPPEETIPAYFAELASTARAGGFDVLSHADVFKRTAYDVYGRFDITEWEDLVRPVWQACIDNNIGIEINSSGLRKPVGQPHPSLEAVRWYREMGGERLTIGSDSHRPVHVGAGLDTALDIARAAGFTRLCSFEKRQLVRWIEI